MTATPIEQAKLWKKFMRLTRAGVPFVRALEVVIEESGDTAIRGVAQALHQKLRDGDPLAAAVASMPEVFSLSSRELIKTAETRGAWDEILLELADGLLDGTFN